MTALNFIVTALLLATVLIPKSANSALEWGSFSTDESCTCGHTVYYSKLWYIPSGQDWVDTCIVTPGTPPGSSQAILPFKCYKNFWGVYGYFAVPTNCGYYQPYYGAFSDQGCSKPGKRRWGARLWNIEGSWETCCAIFGPTTIQGQTLKRPNKCRNHGIFSGEWGYFDVADKTCLPRTSRQDNCVTEYQRKKRSISATDRVFPFFLCGLMIERHQLSLTAAPSRGNACPDPIISYQHGYRTRIEFLEARIHRCNLNTGTAPNEATRERARTLGEQNVIQYESGIRVNDDAGHILGNQLGGIGTIWYNIFPQNRRYNRGNTIGVPLQNREWREMEDDIRRRVTANCNLNNHNCFIGVWHELLYDADTATRPIGVHVQYQTAPGSQDWITYVIGNPSNTEA